MLFAVTQDLHSFSPPVAKLQFLSVSFSSSCRPALPPLKKVPPVSSGEKFHRTWLCVRPPPGGGGGARDRNFKEGRQGGGGEKRKKILPCLALVACLACLAICGFFTPPSLKNIFFLPNAIFLARGQIAVPYNTFVRTRTQYNNLPSPLPHVERVG